MRIFAIRPEPGLSATIAAATAAGLDIAGFALAAIEPVPPMPEPTGPFDALVLGSANAVRCASDLLASWRGRTAHVVGEATAEAARGAGLAVGQVGSGGLQDLVDAIAPEARGARLMRLAGERHVALRVPAGVTLDTCVVYRVAYREMPPAFVEMLAGKGLVLLHSGEAARHFAAECARNGVDRGVIALAALAPRIAQAAGDGWREVAVAPVPTDRALLALAGDMCH